MKKLATSFLGVLLMAAPVVLNAQISTRTDAPSDLNFGTRPSAGTKMLTFNFDIAPDSGFGFGGGNLYNRLGIANGRLFLFKYFLSDNVAARVGFNTTRIATASSGEVDTAATPKPLPPQTDSDTLVSNSLKSVDRSWLFVPGIEYHFDYSNIFDVYAGVDLIIGGGSQLSRNDREYIKDRYNRMLQKTSYFAFGLVPVIGVNMFIVDLPISIGVEYGFNALWKFGAGRTKVTSEIKDATGAETSLEYYTQETDPLGSADGWAYSSLKRRSVSVNTMNNFRITLNLYFN